GLDAPSDLWALGVRLVDAPALARATWRGQELTAHSDEREQRLFLIPGDDRRIELELVFDGAAPDAVDATAVSRSLPVEAQPLLTARGPNAVSSGMGDLFVVHLLAQLDTGAHGI